MTTLSTPTARGHGELCTIRSVCCIRISGHTGGNNDNASIDLPNLLQCIQCHVIFSCVFLISFCFPSQFGSMGLLDCVFGGQQSDWLYCTHAAHPGACQWSAASQWNGAVRRRWRVSGGCCWAGMPLAGGDEHGLGLIIDCECIACADGAAAVSNGRSVVLLTRIGNCAI